MPRRGKKGSAETHGRFRDEVLADPCCFVWREGSGMTVERGWGGTKNRQIRKIVDNSILLFVIYEYILTVFVYWSKIKTRRCAMENTRRDRFLRLAPRRTQKIIDALEVLGNCANTSNYEYTDDDVKKIFAAIRDAVQHTESKFLADSMKRKKFKL